MDPLTGVGGCWQAERVKTMNSDLAGKVVLITGASGGLGSAMAGLSQLRERGWCCTTIPGGPRRNSWLASSEAVESLVAGADLRDEAQVRALFSQAGRRFGRVDTLVANAGVWSEKDVPIADMSLAQWQETLAADLTSVFSAAGVPPLARSQQQGNIVVIGSTAGVFGEPGHGDYAAAKSALAYGFTHTLKNEIARLAPHTASYCGGRVNCVCPGWTVSPMSEKHLQEHEMIRRVTATMALPQIARADDIANAVVYLASDRLARHVTGQTLVIAGGMEGRLLWSPEEIDPTIA